MNGARAHATESGPTIRRKRHNPRRLRFPIVAAIAGLLVGRAEHPFGPPALASQPSEASTIDQSILPLQFRTTWDAGIPGGIPSDADPARPAQVWLPSGNPYNGYSVNPALTKPTKAAAFTAALQDAINRAGAEASSTSRRIVKLAPGTYYVNPQIYRTLGTQGVYIGQVGIYVGVDNVTIRGSGANSTRLIAAKGIGELGTVVLFGHRSGWADGNPLGVDVVQSLAESAVRGQTQITVPNAAAFRVNDIVTIDRKDGAAQQVGPAMFNGGYLWFYDGKYFKRQPARDWNGPGTGATPIGNVSSLSDANTEAAQRVHNWRSRMQTTEITAISGNILTIRDPLHLDFPAGYAAEGGDAEVWRTVPADRSVPMGNRWSGIEDIAVAGGNNNWGFPGGTVAFSYMAYAWAKNIEADGDRGRKPAGSPGKWGNNIGVGRSYRVEVRDSYAHGSADINPGGQAYGIFVGVGSSACLVENNISVNNNKPLTLNSTGGGNVIAYNYVDQAIIWNAPGWQENGIDDSHANFTHHDLIEGNWAPNLGGDTTHGNSAFHTHLRNYAHGTNLLGGATTSNRRAVGMDGWTHDHAYIGNVLNGGTVYETTPNMRTGIPVYQLGNNYAGVGGNWDDGYAAAHIYRYGNWDNVSQRVEPASCVPSTCSLPNSFYLSAQPGFFTSGYAWPWVNPFGDAAGQRVGRLPAKARFDARSPNVPVP